MNSETGPMNIPALVDDFTACYPERCQSCNATVGLNVINFALRVVDGGLKIEQAKQAIINNAQLVDEYCGSGPLTQSEIYNGPQYAYQKCNFGDILQQDNIIGKYL